MMGIKLKIDIFPALRARVGTLLEARGSRVGVKGNLWIRVWHLRKSQAGKGLKGPLAS